MSSNLRPTHRHSHRPSTGYYTSPQTWAYTASHQTETPSRIPRLISTPSTASTASTVGTGQRTPGSASTVSITPSRISYPSLHSRNASTASRRQDWQSNNATTNGTSPTSQNEPRLSDSLASRKSRKRSRPMSTDLSATSPFAQVSPHQGPYSHIGSRFHHANLPSPPPPVNLDYDLAGGGAFTNGFFAATPGANGVGKMSESNTPSMNRAEGRFARSEWHSQSTADVADVDMGAAEMTTPESSFSQNGGHSSLQGPLPELNKSQLGWGSFMLGVVGGVVGGVLAFCRNSPIRGFYAGAGQGFDIQNPPTTPAGRDWGNATASENLWEDLDDDVARRQREDDSMIRSFDRLETPIPGGYPPSPDELDVREEVMNLDEESSRGSKRRQSDKGEWVVVSNGDDTAARKTSIFSRASRTNSPLPIDGLRAQRQSALQSPSFTHRRIASTKRPQHRVSYAGSPAVQQQGFETPRPSSRASQRHSVSGIGYSPASPGKKTSPASAEAKKYAARIKRDERQVGQKVEKLNDNVLEMIRQAKEALGTRVEIVEENEADNGKW